MNEVATDNHFVSIVGIDKMPDMMLGRLPVSTLTEANRWFQRSLIMKLSHWKATGIRTGFYF